MTETCKKTTYSIISVLRVHDSHTSWKPPATSIDVKDHLCPVLVRTKKRACTTHPQNTTQCLQSYCAQSSVIDIILINMPSKIFEN